MRLYKSSVKRPACYVCGNSAGQYRRQENDGYSTIKCGECELEYTTICTTVLILAVSLLYREALSEITGGQP